MEEGYQRVVMCSGKVYYELAKKRADMKMEKEVAIIRLEQVHALHHSAEFTTCVSWLLVLLVTAQTRSKAICLFCAWLYF